MKERYDQILLILPKGEKERLKEHVRRQGDGSLTAFIKRAMREAVERDIGLKGA